MVQLVIILQIFFGFDNTKKALKSIEKEQFKEARELLIEGIRKDSINAGDHYVLSLLFTIPRYKQYNVDSAYFYILEAGKDYRQSDEKKLEKLSKIPISDSLINIHQRKVEDLGFERAKKENSIEAYEYFIQNFNKSLRINEAISLRNELIFEEVTKENTWQAYKQFIQSFPDAKQTSEARSRYERLLFLDKTSSGNRESFENFLKDYPQTTYRDIAEEKIADFVIAENTLEEYNFFLQQYPSSDQIKRIKDFQYHTAMELGKPWSFSNDSLLKIKSLCKDFYIPVDDIGRYKFIDPLGNALSFYSDSLYQLYRCELPSEDVFVLFQDGEGKLAGLDGNILYHGAFDEINDMGFGLLLVKTGSSFRIVHKSGRLLAYDLDGAQMLSQQLILFERNGRLGLLLMNGKIIIEPVYESIVLRGSFIVLEKNELFAITTFEKLTNGHQPELKYDDYELIGEHILAWQDDKEMLLNNLLQVKIDPGNHQIIPFGELWLLEYDERAILLNQYFEKINSCRNTLKNDYHLACQATDYWNIYDKRTIYQSGVDTVWYLNDAFLAYKWTDSLYCITPTGKSIQLRSSSFRLPPVVNEEKPFITTLFNDSLQTVYNDTSRVFPMTEPFSFLEHYLVIEKKGKKGLMDLSGNMLLNPTFEVITNNKKGFFSLFNKKEFGLYHPEKNILLKPAYDKIPDIYHDSLFLVADDDSLAFITPSEGRISDFIFHQIKYWNDSIALVSRASGWYLWHIYDQKELYGPFERVKYIRNDSILVINVAFDGEFGIFSNIHGEVVPPIFNDVIPVGTEEHPVYFCEEYVPEADLQVLVYYNETGERIYRTAVTKEDYLKLVCED